MNYEMYTGWKQELVKSITSELTDKRHSSEVTHFDLVIISGK